MKKLFSTLLLLICSSAMADTFILNCEYEYEYETYTSRNESYKKFTMKGSEFNGKIYFAASEKYLPTYYFPETGGPAKWHNQAEFKFAAVLDGSELKYNFKFSNFLRNRQNFQVVYDETKVVMLDELYEEDEDSFDSLDGETIESETSINNGPWINETGVQLDSCELIVK